MPFYDRDAGVLYVSMTEGRAKTANLRRDPRATLEVTSPDGRAWATAEGTATLVGPGTDPTAPRSRRWWTTTASPPASTRTGTSTGRSMVSDRRVLMTMTVDHVYGERLR